MKAMNSKVIDKVRVIGRGWVIVVEPDGEISMTDKLTCNGTEFTIAGIESVTFMKKVGLILRPNDMVDKTISVGDDIVIESA